MTLTKNGIKALVRLKQTLRETVIETEHPNVHFDMARFCYDTQTDIGLPPRVPSDICGTAACLAGHLVLQEKGSLFKREVSIDYAARRILYDAAYKSCPLFYTTEWPTKFQILYVEANTDNKRAKVGIKAIDWFLKRDAIEALAEGR